MSRYTQEELLAKASSALWHKTAAPIMYAHMIAAICGLTGLSKQEVEKRIEMMSNNDFSFEVKP